MKVNCNASYHHHPNQKIRIAVVVRDFQTHAVATFRTVKAHTNSLFVADSLALLLALQFGKELGLSHIILERDAKQIISKLEWRWFHFARCVTFTPFTCFVVAHYLAKDAILCAGDVKTYNETLSYIFSSVLKDALYILVT